MFKKIGLGLVVLAGLVGGGSPASAQNLTRSQLDAAIVARLPTNAQGAITAVVLQQALMLMTANTVLFTDPTLSSLPWKAIDDYGAVGDGVADDQPAAANAAFALGPKGGTVLLSCNKNYRFGTSWTIPNNVTLQICQSPPNKPYAWLAGTNVPSHLLLDSTASITLSERAGIVGIITQTAIDSGLPTLDASGFAGTAIIVPAGASTNETQLDVLLVGFARCLDGTGATQAGRPNWRIECDAQAGPAGSTNAAITVPPSFDRGYVAAHTWPYATAAHAGGNNRRTGYAVSTAAGNCDDETFDIFSSFWEVGFHNRCFGSANWKSIWLENNAVVNMIDDGGGFNQVDAMWLWKDATATPSQFNTSREWYIKYLFCGVGGAGPCLTANNTSQATIHIGHLDVNGGSTATSVLHAATLFTSFKIDGCSIQAMLGTPAPFTGVFGTTVDQFVLSGGCQYLSNGSWYSGQDFTYIPSAATLVLYPQIDRYGVTGTTPFTNIVTGWAGRNIELFFTDSFTISDVPGVIELQNNEPFTTSVGAVLKLKSNLAGTWYETSRSPMATAAFASTGTSGHTVPFLDGVNTWSGVQTLSVAPIFSTLTGYLKGNGAGALTAAATVPASDLSGQVALANGGTGANLSATGGASQVLKQAGVGAAVTVGQLAASDLSNGTTGSGSVVLATSPTLVTPALGVTSSTPSAVAGTLSFTKPFTLSIPNLKLWFDASCLVDDSTTACGTVASGAASQWTDLSGNANHATQGTGSAQPTLQAAAQNGLNTLRFTGANSQLMTLASELTITSYTTISVKRRAGPAGANQVVILGDTNTTSLMCWWFTDAKVYIYGNGEYFTTQAANSTNYVVFSTTKTADVADAYLIGNQLALAGPNVLAVGSTFDNVGSSQATFTNGEIAEMFVFDRVLSRSEREAVEDYLANKWNAKIL